MDTSEGRSPVAVLAAQPEETRALVARLAARRQVRLEGGRAWTGRLGAAEVIVAVSGVGRENARRGARILLGTGPSRLLVIGVAGALSPELTVGSLVVARRVRVERQGWLEVRSTDPGAVAAARALEGVVVGEALTVDRVVISAERRAELLAKRGAARQAGVVVDLESWDAVSEADRRGVPVTVLRVVSDAAQESLPSILGSVQRPDGSLDRARLVRAALLRPTTIPVLLELRRRVARGATTLAEIVPRLLDSLAPSPPGGAGPLRGHRLPRV